MDVLVMLSLSRRPCAAAPLAVDSVCLLYPIYFHLYNFLYCSSIRCKPYNAESTAKEPIQPAREGDICITQLSIIIQSASILRSGPEPVFPSLLN